MMATPSGPFEATRDRYPERFGLDDTDNVR